MPDFVNITQQLTEFELLGTPRFSSYLAELTPAVETTLFQRSLVERASAKK